MIKTKKHQKNKYALGLVGIGLASIAFAFFSYLFINESITEARETRLATPPGKIVSLKDGRKIHINCTGNGTKTVILESGTGALSTKWAGVQPELSKSARVCSYDRSGLGYSDEGPGERNGGVEANDLYELLQATNEKPPYVLAGHSLGGEIMRIFAARHKGDVAGVVMVDPAHESDITIKNDSSLNNKLNNAQQVIEIDQLGNASLIIGMIQAMLGVVRDDALSTERPDNEVTRVEREQGDEGYLWGGKRLRTVVREGGAVLQTLFIENKEASDLGDLPVVFIVQPSRLNQSEAFCKISTNCSVIASSKDDHEIPEYQPQIIIESLQKIMNGQTK